MYKCCRNQIVYGLIRAKLDHYSRVKGPKRGQYIHVEEGTWGTDKSFPYQQLLDESMLDESSLESDKKCMETPKLQLNLCNERLKYMSKKPAVILNPRYIELFQDYIDERKIEAIRKLDVHLMY